MTGCSIGTDPPNWNLGIYGLHAFGHFAPMTLMAYLEMCTEKT